VCVAVPPGGERGRTLSSPRRNADLSPSSDMEMEVELEEGTRKRKGRETVSEDPDDSLSSPDREGRRDKKKKEVEGDSVAH